MIGRENKSKIGRNEEKEQKGWRQQWERTGKDGDGKKNGGGRNRVN